MTRNIMNMKADEMRKELERLDNLATIYTNIENQMNWDVMVRSDERDENGDYTYTAPDKDSYEYDRYLVWMEVMKAIERLAK